MNLLPHLRLSLQPPHLQAAGFFPSQASWQRQLSLRPALHALASTCIKQTGRLWSGKRIFGSLIWGGWPRGDHLWRSSSEGTGMSTRLQRPHGDCACEPPPLPAAPAPQMPARSCGSRLCISSTPGSTHATDTSMLTWTASPPFPAVPMPDSSTLTWTAPLHLRHYRQHPHHRIQRAHVDHASAPPPIPAAPAPPSPLQLQPITGFVVPLGSSLHTRVHGRVVPACGMGGAAQPVWVSAPSLFVIEPIQQLAAAAGPLLAQSHSSGEES